MRFLSVASFAFALLGFAAQPSWAIYKCTVQGRVTFQDGACSGDAVQTRVGPESPPDAAPTNPTPDPQATAPRPSLQQQLSAAEAYRLRTEAGYALRDKKVRLANQRAACDAEQRTILGERSRPAGNTGNVPGFVDSDRTRATRDLADATREQSTATKAAAAATRCDTQARALQAEVDEAIRQCQIRGCK